MTAKGSLNISLSKTTMIAFTRRRKVGGLETLKLRSERIKLSEEVKYLGVIFDSKLT